jgi:outer membrane receptor for ferric coprogen and ferric-rhodotorulic acid
MAVRAFPSPSMAPALRLRPLVLALSVALGHCAFAAEPAAADASPSAAEAPADQAKGDSAMPMVTVTGVNESDYVTRKSAASTGLDLSLRETPQSVSVVTRARMDDFHMNSVNDVLANTTGVTVENVETDRKYYTARGFDIVNFSEDGVGIPLVFGLVTGDLDTVFYDRVEVVRGANGQSSSTGNPSASVNFVRKRPTDTLQGSASVSYGSWSTSRVEGDISGPLNEDGSLKARLIVAREEGDSYLDYYSPQKTLFYGVVEAKLGRNTVLTVGNSYENNKASGAMWGALPLYYTDGSMTNYDRSTNTATDWSQQNTRKNNTFAELVHHLNSDWELKSTLSHGTERTDSRLEYVYGTPDKETGDGLYSYPSLYQADYEQTLVNLSASGKFSLGGRRHDLTFGASWAKSTMVNTSYYGDDVGTALPGNTAFDGSYPEPAYDSYSDGSDFTDRRKTVSAAARWNLADDLKLLTGVNFAKVNTNGIAYGVSSYRSATGTTPYAGLVYDLNKNVSVYGSYTEIFNPQSSLDSNNQPLAPVEGRTMELGVKSEVMDGKLNLTGAIYKTKQENAAEQAGYIGTQAYYTGIDATSEGFELDATGELARGWQVSAGYSQLRLTDDDGNDARIFIPRKTLRASTTYRVPAVPQLKVGANFTWQSEIRYAASDSVTLHQSAYGLLGLMAQYDINKHLSVSVNLNNLADKKYITSLYWEQGYYGAGRNGSATLSYKF